MDEDRLAHLRRKRDTLHKMLLEEHLLMVAAKEKFNAVKHQFEAVDREVALMCRTVLPPSGTTKRKQKKPRDFSKEEIQQIADKLKVNITFKA